jgi:hypothetical protein
MRLASIMTASTLIALTTAGCGHVVDDNYPGPPLARLRIAVTLASQLLTYRTSVAVGLLWSLEDPKRGHRYAVTNGQDICAPCTSSLWQGSDTLLDVYDEMPGIGEIGYAFVALFYGDPSKTDDPIFGDPPTLLAVDTTHLLVFARSQDQPPAGGVVWPRSLVVDNPERLVGPGYHLAEARCGADGAAQKPMHVALVDEPLDRDDPRPRFSLVPDEHLAAASNAVGGIPSGPVPQSCLVLP